MKPLNGHVSQETAYVVDSYPYGANKRCRIRYWIEEHPKRGYRFVSQTENPSNGQWNKPKLGTYCLLSMGMYLDEKNHVKIDCLTEYSPVEDILKFLKEFPDNKVGLTLKALVLTRLRMTRKTIAGEHNFTISGVPQMPSDLDIEKAKTELPQWDEIISIIKSR